MKPPSAERPPVRTTHGVAAAVATGLLVVLAAPGVLPWSAAGWLAWVAFVPLLLVLDRVSIRCAALLGWLAGLTLTLGLCPWFPGLLARFANLHPAWAVLATGVIAAVQALTWAGWAALVRARPRVIPLALLAPAAFVAIERWVPLIFPYSLGLTQYRALWLLQAAELGGPYVLTFLCIAAAAALVGVIDARGQRRPWPARPLVAVGSAIVVTAVFGYVRVEQVREDRRGAPTLTVAAVQAGVVHTGWSTPPDDPDVLRRYQQTSARTEQEHGPVDLLLWPEKAYPLLIRADARHDYRPGHRRRVRRGFDGALAFGLTSVDPATRQVQNSVALLDEHGSLRVVYDKVKLILYSEWLPWWMQGWFEGGKRYEPGRRFSPVWLRTSAGTVPVAFFICFESGFPAHVARLMRRGPQLLINLSDDAWFGDTVEPEQHLSQVVFRAVESRRDLVRATGSGISAFITAAGEIDRALPIHRSADQARGLVGEVRLLTRSGLYATVHDGPACCCALVSLAVLILVLRRRLAGSGRLGHWR